MILLGFIRMPRSGSSSRSSVRSPTRSSYKPATIAHTSKPIPSPSTVHHTVEAPTLGQTIKQGFGWGMGNAIAHRIFGTTPVIHHTPTTIPSNLTNPEYEKCMKESFNDKEACKQYLSEGGK